MTRDPNDRPSIFNTPFEDEPLPPAADPDVTAAVPATNAEESRTRSVPEPRQAPMEDGAPPQQPTDRSRMIAIAGIGLLALAITGFVGVSLLREPEATGAVASGSPSAPPPSAEPGESAPPQSASAAPTPVPTPAGPPSELAVGGWSTVGAEELPVKSDAGEASESVYRLVNGAIVHVNEGPTVIDGANWYHVTSLGGASGWASSGVESDPALETLTAEPGLSECGQVREPVFDTSGALAPNDPLRLGTFALPASAFDDRTLAAFELVRGMADEACFSARQLSDGTIEVSSEFAAGACGHAVPLGHLYQLVPVEDERLSLASTVVDPTLVHPTLLEGGPPDHRMSTNLETIMTMLANEGTVGCLNTNGVQRGTAIESYRSMSAYQCSVVELYDQFSLKLVPSSGGPTAWLKLSGSDYQSRLFQVGQRASVSIDANASDEDNYLYAWPQEEC